MIITVYTVIRVRGNVSLLVYSNYSCTLPQPLVYLLTTMWYRALLRLGMKLLPQNHSSWSLFSPGIALQILEAPNHAKLFIPNQRSLNHLPPLSTPCSSACNVYLCRFLVESFLCPCTSVPYQSRGVLGFPHFALVFI